MKAGAVSELERLYREQGNRMWRSVVLFTGDPEVASDSVAEAFAQALNRGSGIRQVGPWVWQTVFRIAAGEMKRRSRSESLVPEASYEMPESTTALVSALAELSPKQRAAVILHYYAGYPVRDVAERIGSTASAVGVHLHRARVRLRELLGEDDE